MTASATTTPRFHHIAIQTNDLDNSVSWYEAFLGGRQAWSLDEFSELTRSRLPGLRRLTELVVGNVRLHIMERDGQPAHRPSDSLVQYQHLCMAIATSEELAALRQRWIDLHRSGRHTFALDEPPTDIVIDDDGVESFYAMDPNGLELEFTYVPRVTGRER
jgi:catechol 2,3-dioxygenase-like lactoylglutathione lyase family enzyme